MDAGGDGGVDGEKSKAEVVNLVVSACKSFLSPSLSHPLPFTASLIHICTQALPSTSSLPSLPLMREEGRRGRWEVRRCSTAAAAAAAAVYCWQENVPVISQYRYRWKKPGKTKNKREGEEKQSSENMPPARLNSLEAGPGHVGVQPGNKGSAGELGER